MNKLGDEFLQFQLLDRKDIPDDVWKSALTHEDDEHTHYRMDVVRGYLSAKKYPDGTLMFRNLSKVAHLVLTLPHSNAEEEVFSAWFQKIGPSLDLV